MRQIVVEPRLSRQLIDQTGQSILCDESGRALGFFSPLPRNTRLDDLNLESPLSIEETEELRKRRGGKPVGKPLSEILSRLGLQ
jgi:hypothetical protein